MTSLPNYSSLGFTNAAQHFCTRTFTTNVTQGGVNLQKRPRHLDKLFILSLVGLLANLFYHAQLLENCLLMRI